MHDCESVLVAALPALVLAVGVALERVIVAARERPRAANHRPLRVHDAAEADRDAPERS